VEGKKQPQTHILFFVFSKIKYVFLLYNKKGKKKKKPWPMALHFFLSQGFYYFKTWENIKKLLVNNSKFYWHGIKMYFYFTNFL